MKSILLLLSLIPSLGYTVSRVGGGKIQSLESQFEITLPSDYWLIQQLGPSQVTAKGPIAYSKEGSYIDLQIRISEFKSYFTDYKDLDPQQLALSLSDKNWKTFDVKSECVVGFKQEKDSLTSYIFTWGDGRGFVMNFQNIPMSEHTVRQILESLVIFPGACSW